jgi:hypothetical protein
MDRSIALKILRDCLRWGEIKYPRADVLTVAHDNDRSLLHDGSWYSPLVDTMEDDLRRKGINCVSVARIISRIKGDLSYGNALSPEGAFARALIAKRLQGLLSRDKYPYSNMEEKIWGQILDATGVRKVIGIQPSRELCAACHKRNIWVADIQHGVIGESHPWYGAAFRAKDPIEQLPDSFLCWDEGSRKVIDVWAGGKGIEIQVTGNRWVTRFQNWSVEDKLVQSLRERFAAHCINPEGKPAVLLALSWGEVNIPNGFMVDAMLRVIQRTSSQYQWFVRLHPNQLNGFATDEGRKFAQYFEENLKGHVESDVASRTALPVVLNQVNVVISWNSSVCIEAAQMGIKTGLMDPRLKVGGEHEDYYAFYKQLGLIELLDSSDEIILEWIQSNIANPRRLDDFSAYESKYQNLLNFLVSA